LQIVARSFGLLMQEGRDLTEARKTPDQLFSLLDMHAALTVRN
jgi:hypothetical protein